MLPTVLSVGALPDTLTGLLSGSPFVYTVAVAPSYFSNGEHIGAAALNRNAGAIYAQDSWKLNARFVVDHAIRHAPDAGRHSRTFHHQ